MNGQTPAAEPLGPELRRTRPGSLEPEHLVAAAWQQTRQTVERLTPWLAAVDLLSGHGYGVEQEMLRHTHGALGAGPGHTCGRRRFGRAATTMS
jgi:hypothetical protein